MSNLTVLFAAVSLAQLSWHVSAAAGFLCERDDVLDDTIKSAPYLKAAVGMKFKDVHFL
jgi:hypothetical protein